jgi:hypothetical protein
VQVVAGDSAPAKVGEVRVVPNTREKVTLLARSSGMKHAILCKVVMRPFPMPRVANQAIRVLP